MIQELLMILGTVLLVLLIRECLAEAIRVKGGSMRGTLQNGEFMLVTRFDYLLGRPKRHDVVICLYPGRYLDKHRIIPQYFVKRVIGLPGETISMEEGVVHINGQPLEESYLQENFVRRKSSMEPRILAEDEYFVMGDNRDSSNDSRRIGPLTRRAIIGRVRAVFFPFKKARWIR